MIRKSAIAAALTALFVLPALAQIPAAGTPTHIRGTVEKLDGKTLTVRVARAQPEGKLTAASITAETDGVKPPL